MDNKFSTCCNILMVDIALVMLLTVQIYLLDIPVGIAVVLDGNGECTTFNCKLRLVEQRTAEPIAGRCRLDFIETEG